jgi:RNA polymerase sigma-70 factor (ECF subfamily)
MAIDKCASLIYSENLTIGEGMITENQSYLSVEKVLISRASKGCLDAFNQLVLRYQNIAYHHAYALLGDAALAEDITQESFIKAFKNFRSFRGPSFRCWLLKIVTNSSYDHLRHFKRHSSQSLFSIEGNGEEYESYRWLVDPSASVETRVVQNEDTKQLYQMLDELPDVYRSVLTLVDLYELDYAEVSEILKVPMGTVKSRLTRARMRMRRKLQNDPKYFIILQPDSASVYTRYWR